MIGGFRHKGLRALYEDGDRRRVPAAYAEKIGRVPARLDGVSDPRDMNLPGFGLHALTDDLAGLWSVVVSRNWRIVFRFDGGDAYDVDLIDYH
jgi:toxin HigB-1